MKKDWVVAFGTEKFYLTTEDMDFYRQGLLGGKKFIALKSGMVLSDKALYIANVDNFEETKMIDKGKTQCEYGRWHSGSCSCEFKYEVIDGKAVKRLKNELI